MKFATTLLIFIGLLIANDVILIKYLGSKNDYSAPALNSEEARSVTVQETTPTAKSQNATNRKRSGDSPNTNREPLNLTEQQFVDTLRSVANSGELADILSQVRVESQQQMAAAQEQFRHMDATQLFEAIVYSDNQQEQSIAMGFLANKGLHKLDISQLRELYQLEGMDGYAKSQALTVLLERKDSQALEWAKGLISNDAGHHDIDLLTYVYEQDPNYIEQYIDGIDVQDVNQITKMFMLLYQEPDLAQRFIDKHLDSFIAAENPSVFQMGLPGTGIKLTKQQQSKVAEMFDSGSRHKREFAIGLVGAIEDTQLLREAYQQLRRNQEKMSFLYSLFGSNNSEVAALAKELAAESDNADLRVLGGFQVQSIQ